MTNDETQTGGLEIGDARIGSDDDAYMRVIKYLTVPKDRQDTATFKSGDVAAIKKLEDPRLRQIADGMFGAKSTYAFTDVAAVQSNWKLRIAMVQTMNDMNTGAIDADYFDPVHNIPPRAYTTYIDDQPNDAHWQIGTTWAPLEAANHGQTLKNPKNWQAAFVAQDDTNVATAISGNEAPFRGECAGALQIALNAGLLDAWGQHIYVANTRPKVLKLGEWEGSNARQHLLKVSTGEPPVYGDYIYIRNDPRYPRLAPYGFWQGLNSVYAGKDRLGVDRFSGLGVSWQTEQEIATLMQNAFLADCKTPANPADIMITARATPVLVQQSAPMTITGAAAPGERKDNGGLTPEELEKAGFRPHGDNLFLRPSVELGTLRTNLGFTMHHLSQTISAPLFNPPYRVGVGGKSIIVEYHDEDAARHSHDSVVNAYALA